MDRIATGLVRTSHGVRGYLKVLTFSGEYEHLCSLKELTLVQGSREKTFVLEDIKPFKDGALVKLQGIDTPEAARGYAKWEIWVDRDHAAPLDEREFYYADLVGLQVLCQGQPAAKIVSVSSGAATELLEVEDEEGKTFFIPFIEQFIGEVSIADKTIVLKDRRLIE